MATALQAKLDRDDEGQFVRLPLGFELPGTVVSIRHEDDRVILEPIRTEPPRAAHLANQPLIDLLHSWTNLDEEFGPVDDLPPDPVDL